MALGVVPVVDDERALAGAVREVINVNEGSIPSNHLVLRFTVDGNVDGSREVPGQSDEGSGLTLGELVFL